MQARAGFDVGRVRLFGCGEHAEVNGFSINHELGIESACSLVEIRAFQPSHAIDLSASVVDLLYWSRRPQIGPSIVKAICVFVVDGVFRPFARHVKPSETVSVVEYAKQPDFPIGNPPHALDPTSFGADRHDISFYLEPLEHPCLWVIMQPLDKLCVINHATDVKELSQ